MRPEIILDTERHGRSHANGALRLDEVVGREVQPLHSQVFEFMELPPHSSHSRDFSEKAVS